MDTCHLGKDMLPHDRLVGSHRDTAKTLNHAGEVVELILHDAGLGVKLVFQDGLHRSHRCITTTFSQPIDGDMQATSSA